MAVGRDELLPRHKLVVGVCLSGRIAFMSAKRALVSGMGCSHISSLLGFRRLFVRFRKEVPRASQGLPVPICDNPGRTSEASEATGLGLCLRCHFHGLKALPFAWDSINPSCRSRHSLFVALTSSDRGFILVLDPFACWQSFCALAILQRLAIILIPQNWSFQSPSVAWGIRCLRNATTTCLKHRGASACDFLTAVTVSSA